MVEEYKVQQLGLSLDHSASVGSTRHVAQELFSRVEAEHSAANMQVTHTTLRHYINGSVRKPLNHFLACMLMLEGN